MYINHVQLYGNLTKDIEVKSTPSGQSVASFSMATNRTWVKDGKKQEQAEFHNVVVWGKQAETCAQWLKKGSPLLVEGRLQTRVWTAKDNTKRYTTEVVAERVQFGPKSGNAAPKAEEQAQDMPFPEEEGIQAEDLAF